METNEMYRGRLIDHLQLVVRDIESAKKFYLPVFETLKIPVSGQGEDYFWVDELFISTKNSKAAAGELTGRMHLAFQAKDRAMVDRFYEVALRSGGKDNGKPGERDYHPGYYGAFVIDPDGNNIEAVYHGEGKKNVDAIKITW